MNKLFIAVVALVFPISVFTQQRITGYLLDATTKNPVEGANIQKDNKLAATSSQKGRFVLEINNIPFKLEITHVGYYTKEIIVSQFPDDSLFIDLIPRTQNLDEVIISGKPYIQFFKNSTFYIQDYVIQKDKIWAIGFPDKNILKPELRLLNFVGKMLDKTLVNQNSGLFQDPSGTVHLYNPDSVFQLYFDGSQINFAYPNPMDESAEVLFNFQVIRGDTVIFRDFNPNRSYCEFVAANPVLGTRDTIFGSYNRNLYKSGNSAQNYTIGTIPTCAIFETPPGHLGEGFPSQLRESGEHPEYAQMSDKDIMTAEGAKIAKKTPKDVGLELTRSSRKEFSDYAYNRTIVNKAVKADLFCCKNIFYVFESTNLMLWRLNADYKILDSFIIGMNPEAKDLRMIQDPVTKLLFLSYRINGTCYISQIDPATGLIAKTRPITGFPFSEKVRIYDGRIYFIYQMATGQTFTNLFSISL